MSSSMNTNNNAYENQASSILKAVVSDQQINKLFLKLKERMDNNEFNSNKKNNSFVRKETDDGEIRETANSQDSTIRISSVLNTNTNSKSKNIFSSNVAINKESLVSKILNSYSEIENTNDLNIKSDNNVNICLNDLNANRFLTEISEIKDIREKLVNGYNYFIKKIHNNRGDIDIKLDIPVEIQADLYRQKNTIELQGDIKNQIDRFSSLISKLTKRSKDNLLINKIEEQRWKEELNKQIISGKSYIEKLGENYWMASLRKPNRFYGERKSFYETGNNWYIFKEKIPIHWKL